MMRRKNKAMFTAILVAFGGLLLKAIRVGYPLIVKGLRVSYHEYLYWYRALKKMVNKRVQNEEDLRNVITSHELEPKS